MHTIRPYNHSDFKMISSWWLDYGGVAPIEGTMVEDGSFILELDKVPSLIITVLLTQSKELAFIEGFIKNPILKNINIEPYGNILWNHGCSYAKQLGYQRIICLTDKEKLFSKYERFGMTRSLPMMCFVKEL